MKITNRTGLGMLLAVLLSGLATLPRASAADAVELDILTEEHPPLNFTEAGKATGLATEVVREIMARTGTVADIRSLPWVEGYRAVMEKPNTALYTTALIQERKDKLQWVGPIAVLDTNFYAPRNSGLRIANLDAARKVARIATVAGYYSEQVLRKEGFTNLESCPSEAAGLGKLLRGEVQLFVSSNMAMPAALKEVGAGRDDVENVFTLSTDLEYVAFSRATPAGLVVRWQAALDAMKRDGTFRRIHDKWLPGEMPPGIYQLVTEQYPPVTFMKDGKPAGFVTDLVREIAARQDIPDNIRLTAWKNAYNMALLHPKVVLFSAERTPERESLFRWVGPVGKNSAAFYARKGSGIRVNRLEEAKGLDAVATTTNWFTEQYLKGKGFANLVSSPDPAENVRQLMQGEVQLAVFTDITIPDIVGSAGYRMADLEPVLVVSRTDFYIAMSRDMPDEVVNAWQSTLDGMKRDGSFERIYRRYLPDADLVDLVTLPAPH